MLIKQTRQPWNRILSGLATAAASLLLGFAFWFLLLGVGVVFAFLQVPVRVHDASDHPLWLTGALSLAYPGLFALSAYITRCFSWSYATPILAPAAYVVFLTVYIPSSPRPLGWGMDSAVLFSPIISSCFGALAASYRLSNTDVES